MYTLCIHEEKLNLVYRILIIAKKNHEHTLCTPSKQTIKHTKWLKSHLHTLVYMKKNESRIQNIDNSRKYHIYTPYVHHQNKLIDPQMTKTHVHISKMNKIRF